MLLSHARSSLLGIALGESTSTTCPNLKPLPSCACPEIDYLLALLDICSALPRLTCELEHPLWEAPIQPSSRAHAAAFSSTPAHVLAFLPSFTARPCHSFSCRFLPASTLHFLCCSPTSFRNLTYRFCPLLHVIGRHPSLAHPLHHPPPAPRLALHAATQSRGSATAPASLLAPQHGLCPSTTVVRAHQRVSRPGTAIHCCTDQHTVSL